MAGFCAKFGPTLTFRFNGPILDFWIPVSVDGIDMDLTEMPSYENGDLTV